MLAIQLLSVCSLCPFLNTAVCLLDKDLNFPFNVNFEKYCKRHL
jgi:hypothetical protein